MNRAAFYAHLRKRDSGLFGTSLTKEQVAGMEAILDAASALPISHVAYCLATAYHETGQKMSPNVESLNYSVEGLLKTFGRHRITVAQAEKYGRKPGKSADQRAIANTIYGGEWGLQNLGNTLPDDGWTLRGHGMVHITGRRNFVKAGGRLGIDLVGKPSLALDMAIAAKCLVLGMAEGWYTGHRLSQYLPGKYVEARRIINGQDKAVPIATHARAFEAALVAAGYAEKPQAPRPAPKAPEVIPDAPAPRGSLLDAIMGILRAIFGGRA